MQTEQKIVNLNDVMLLREISALRLMMQVNSRLRLEVLAGLSKIFREHEVHITDALLSSVVFASASEVAEASSTPRKSGTSKPDKKKDPPQKPDPPQVPPQRRRKPKPKPIKK